MILGFIKRSIKSKSIVLLVLFGMLPIVILSFISNRISCNILESELNKTMYQTLEKASVSIDLFLQRMSDLSDFLSGSSDITASMNTEGLPETSEKSRAKNTINQTLRNVSQFFNFPVHIFIIDKSNNVYSNIGITADEKKKILDSIKKDSAYKIPLKLVDTKYWLGIRKNLLAGYDSDNIYYLAKNIMSNGELQGVMYIGTSDYILLRMLDNIKLSDQSMIFALDGNEGGKVIDSENYTGTDADKKIIEKFANENTVPHNVILSGISYSTTFYSTSFNWRIAMLTPINSIRDKLSVINRISIIVILITVFCITIFLLLINLSLIKPIIHLSRLMKMARKGNLEIRSDIANTDEIGILSEGFNKLLVDFKKMLEKTQADEIRKKDLEFKVLQSQIKPHFLYNSLNSIRWIAEMNNESKVGDSIVSLVRMLEYNTRDNEKIIKVMDEIQYIKEYLQLQSLRYWNRFAAEFDISDEIINTKMLKLTLQPIVENCLMHGLGNNEKLLISISGARDQNTIIFTIRDNGIGMEETKLLQLNKTLEEIKEYGKGPNKDDSNDKENIINKESIGIRNVNQRIRLEFGNSYGISIKSIMGQGTDVSITLPLIT